MIATRSRRGWLAVAAATLLASACTSGSGDGGSDPDPGPGSDGPESQGASWVVTLGDSYISGEGVRWAGNTSAKPGPVDALGREAYFDRGGRESEPGCHRAVEAIADVGGGLQGKTLACSGATTSSQLSGNTFKPGLDFFDDGEGHIGQALALQRFATNHQVSAVVISIGGNDFGFGSLVTQCATDFISTVGARPKYCKDDPAVQTIFDDNNVASVTAGIAGAISRVAGAMQRAGYARDDYSMTVLNYPAPIAVGSEIRYPQTLSAREASGCPVYDADATWAVSTAVPTINQAVADAVDDVRLSNIGLLDVSGAFDGHRLCEDGIGQLSDTSLGSWRDDGAVDQLEWVNMAYTKGAPWQLQESFHPNYWGMLAERSCLRHVLESDPIEYGRCEPAGDGLRSGEPVMELEP